MAWPYAIFFITASTWQSSYTTSCQPMTMLAAGNLTALKSAHHALTPEKTETTSYDDLILIARNGAESSLSLSIPPATNSIPNPTSKWSYSQQWRPGLMTILPIFLHIPPCIPPLSTNRQRLGGASSLMVTSAPSGHNFRVNTYTNKVSTIRRTLDCIWEGAYPVWHIAMWHITFFCGPSSNNYVTSHVILRYLRD
jgi:hypothetical protein